MIAMKDKNGFVAGTVPGLSRMAVVTLEECKDALKVLASPDKESRNGENEGRRIRAVDGGWVVLGNARFQALMKEVSTKIGNAKRQKKYRQKKSGAVSSGPLPGEAEAIAAENNGASQERVDDITTSHLPEQCQ